MVAIKSSNQFISTHGLASGLLRAIIFFALMGFAFRAQAESVATGERSFNAAAVKASTLTCVFNDLRSGESCPAYSTARTLEFLGMGEEAIIFIEQEPAVKAPGRKSSESASQLSSRVERTSVLASSRIEDSVLLEDIDEDDAMLLEREILELSGARYELPKTRAEIKKMIGFPESVDVASEDWIEMIRVHAQMTLSLSQNASVFLLEQMGLSASAVAAPTVAEPTAAPPVVAQPDSVEATAESPDSTAEIDVTNGTATETPAAATNLQPAADELHPAVIETY
jgi:hypothetical protein